jgi:hypothetical protein
LFWVPSNSLWATEMIRIVCKETLQSLVTMFTNMELEIRVKRLTRTTEAIADYVGREYRKKKVIFGEEPEGKRTQRAGNAG